MSAKQDEKLKHFASYMNGLAIGLFTTGCLTVVASLVLKEEPMTTQRGLTYMLFFCASIMWHLAGRYALNKLSDK